MELSELKNDGRKLVYTLQSTDELDKISVEMIWRNQREMQCLLPIRFLSEDGCINALEYDISSTKTLEDYLKHFAINKKQFIEIAVAILDNLERCNYYMLPDKQIILQENAIYLDPVTLHVALLCVPLTNHEQEMDLRGFFVSMLEHTKLNASASTESADFQKLYDAIRTKKLDVSTLRADIISFLGESEKSEKLQGALSNLDSGQSTVQNKASSNDSHNDLVDVVQNAISAPAMQDLIVEKGSKGRLHIPSLKLFGKEKKQENSGDSISRLRQLQGGNKIKPQQPPVGGNSAQTEPPTQRQPQHFSALDAKNHSGSILLMHDAPPIKAFLICKDGKISIDPEGTWIGRKDIPTKEKVKIYLDSIHVSAPHARISYDFEQECYTIIDVSLNGVRQNGVRISKSIPIPLHHNDELLFANVPCRIVLEADEKIGG